VREADGGAVDVAASGGAIAKKEHSKISRKGNLTTDVWFSRDNARERASVKMGDQPGTGLTKTTSGGVLKQGTKRMGHGRHTFALDDRVSARSTLSGNQDGVGCRGGITGKEKTHCK